VWCGPPLTAGVCAVHAVMLGGESPLSRCPWSRRTREAQGRHRAVGSEGSVERTCGARDTNPIRGVVPSGRAGTRPRRPPSTSGRCFIHRASMHGRYDRFPREASHGPREVACHGKWLRDEESSLTAWEESADGRVPAATQGRPERSYRRVTGRLHGRRPDRALCCCGEPPANVLACEGMLKRPNRRIRDPYVRWGGRGGVARPPPIPIRLPREQGISHL
jgi:hypothetical protein